MAGGRVTIRLEDNLYDDLENEAKNRGQTVAALVRTFVRDGLARYDAVGEATLQSTEKIEKSLEVVKALIAANLHHAVEDWTRTKLIKDQNESDAEYIARVNPAYRNRIERVIAGGERLVAGIPEKKK